MSGLLIRGGRSLGGRLRVDGNKNAALPLLAACLLTPEECVLDNVPEIRDVEAMAQLLVGLGATVDGIGTSTVTVRCAEIATTAPDAALVGRLRGSVLLLGPLLARGGGARLREPGGDFPSRRTITTHLRGLEALGVRVKDDGERSLVAPEGLSGASLYLEEASVTATETILLAAAGARGTTEVRNAACEPHVAELGVFLSQLGAVVEGAGTPTVRVTGSERLSGARHALWGDYIEAGSWGVIAACTGGEVTIDGVRDLDVEPVIAALRSLGVECRHADGGFSVARSRLKASGRITTNLWPGFPSDLVSLVTILATQAEGGTLIHDWMYELRLFALEQLSGMGADLFLCDPHRIIVNGPTPLRGRSLDSRDIRSGMAMIAAALTASGESRVAPLETVERGYGRLVERLYAIGADVRRES